LVDERVLEIEVMSPDTEVSHRLASAIGEFREEVLFWIDTELVRLREQAEHRQIEEGPAAETDSQFSGSNERFRASPGRPSIESRMGRREPRIIETAGDRDPGAENARHPLEVTEAARDPDTPAGLSNPRQRLDALARVLDHRLKHAQSEAGTRMRAAREPDAEVEDETPEPFRREGRG
jgi:hypothetical protein